MCCRGTAPGCHTLCDFQRVEFRFCGTWELAEEVKIPTLAKNARMGHPPQTYFTSTSKPLRALRRKSVLATDISIAHIFVVRVRRALTTAHSILSGNTGIAA